MTHANLAPSADRRTGKLDQPSRGCGLRAARHDCLPPQVPCWRVCGSRGRRPVQLALQHADHSGPLPGLGLPQDAPHTGESRTNTVAIPKERRWPHAVGVAGRRPGPIADIVQVLDGLQQGLALELPQHLVAPFQRCRLRIGIACGTGDPPPADQSNEQQKHESDPDPPTVQERGARSRFGNGRSPITWVPWGGKRNSRGHRVPCRVAPRNPPRSRSNSIQFSSPRDHSTSACPEDFPRP